MLRAGITHQRIVPLLFVAPLAAQAAGLLLAFAPAVASEDKPVDLCDNAVSQNELNACAEQEANKANADMVIALARAMKAMDAVDKDVSEVRPNPAGGIEALELSQRGWLQYREGRCIIEGFAERGGSMEPMMVFHCEEEMARTRIAELNAIAEE
jgi:uncharacterized protein YecT (DUF1311 family)